MPHQTRRHGSHTPSFALFLLGAILATAAPAPRARADGTRIPLPPPVVNPRSTEICMNSRISYHGGWTAGTTTQALANVLFAAARAPMTGAYRTIYAATSQNVSVYDPESHSLTVHKAGDFRSDPTAGFEIGIAAAAVVDAGAAMHLAQLESVALWTGMTSQIASCPRASATTYANSHWDLPAPARIVICFGLRTVPGLTTTLVAISSDGSLPNPATDGSVYMDDALAGPACDSTFAPAELTLEQVSQLLWSSYGCSNHTASGKAGLVCSSAVANYYLTRRIYAAGPAAVHRYHVRRPPGTDATTRDHRIELVRAGDARTALRSALPRIPDAPEYLIVCTGTTDDWPVLEAGFAAGSVALEASTIGLQSWITTGFSIPEQDAIRQATGIPTNDLPVLVVSLGYSSTTTGTGSNDPEAPRSGGPTLELDRGIVEGGGRVAIRYALPAEMQIDLTIHDCLGHEVVHLAGEAQARGTHTLEWECRDAEGRAVPSGVYFCRLAAEGVARTAPIVVLR